MADNPTPLRRAAEAMEDAAFRLTGKDLGTVYRDRIAEEGVRALLNQEEIAKALFQRQHPGFNWEDFPGLASDMYRPMAAAVMNHLLQGADQ